MARANALYTAAHGAGDASSSPNHDDGALVRHDSIDSTEAHASAASTANDVDLLDRDDDPGIDKQLDAVAKAALKRKRHRDIVARSRMRQKATIEAMRAHETALCKQLHRLLIASDRRRALAADDHAIERAMVHRAHEAFVAQVAVQESIRQENEFLQDRIDDLAKFRQMIESECRRISRERQTCATDAHQALPTLVPTTSSDRIADESRARGYWVYFCGHEDPIYYEPLSVQSCEESMQVVYQRMIDLYQDFSLGRIALHETHCFGWRVQRPLHAAAEHERRLLRFQLTKTIRCVDDSMDAIVDRTWQAFHNPALFAKIYSTVVVTRVVQRVNKHMTVLVQNAPNPDGLTNIRYFNVLAKMEGVNERHERVVALVKTIVNPSKIHVQPSATSAAATTQPHDIEWMKHGFSFLLLTDASGGDSRCSERMIQMHYGTHYECLNEAHAQYLMLEVLGLATRWEQLVLPTRCLTF